MRHCPRSDRAHQHPMQPDGGAARQQVEPVALMRPPIYPFSILKASDTKTLVSADLDAGCCQPPPPSSPATRQC